MYITLNKPALIHIIIETLRQILPKDKLHLVKQPTTIKLDYIREVDATKHEEQGQHCL